LTGYLLAVYSCFTVVDIAFTRVLHHMLHRHYVPYNGMQRVLSTTPTSQLILTNSYGLAVPGTCVTACKLVSRSRRRVSTQRTRARLHCPNRQLRARC
jgi:hypothetical protein